MLALSESRAQMLVMGPKQTAMLGIKETDYLPTKMTIQVADSRTTRVFGKAILKIMTVDTKRTTLPEAYIM